jgi:hypothetical protein
MVIPAHELDEHTADIKVFAVISTVNYLQGLKWRVETRLSAQRSIPKAGSPTGFYPWVKVEED